MLEESLLFIMHACVTKQPVVKNYSTRIEKSWIALALLANFKKLEYLLYFFPKIKFV